MKNRTCIRRFLASCCIVILSACGGGSGSTNTTAANSALSGTVAVGAPMLNATLTVMGANGQRVSTPVADNGSYQNLNVSLLTAPYRLQACGLADGQSACYYAFVQSGGVANVTPLTDATVALALAAEAFTLFNGSTPTAAAMANSATTLQNLLGPVLTAAGLSAGSDFATTPFTANHTGMDKVLDAIKVSTGQNAGATFVQLEGVVGSGNAYVDSQGNHSGSLSSSSLISGMGIDLTGISTLFNTLNSAIGSSSVAACTTISAQLPIDPAFALNINDGGQQVAISASNAASSLCSLAGNGGFLGGKVENPTLSSCDFSGADKICTVGFDLTNGTLNLQGPQMAVVLRAGSTTWKLLGEENPYGITVDAAVQRTLRVGISNPQPVYTRAISFDIPTTVSGTATAPHAAKVYEHDASGTGGWDLSAPIVTLNDSDCSGQPNLTVAGSNCGAEWLSLDTFNNGDLSSGDALINALYLRGRDLRIDLYSNTAATAFITSVYVRINGVPPESAQLPGLAWLNLDAQSQSALAAYDGGTTTSHTLNVSWAPNTVVIPHDLTLCGDSACSSKADTELSGSSSQTSATLNLSGMSLVASGYKRLSLYGRDRNEVGYENDYLSCQTGSQGCQ